MSISALIDPWHPLILRGWRGTETTGFWQWFVYEFAGPCCLLLILYYLENKWGFTPKDGKEPRPSTPLGCVHSEQEFAPRPFRFEDLLLEIDESTPRGG